MTDPEIIDGEVVYAVVPHTGEAVDLENATIEQLGLMRAELRDFERDALRMFKRQLDDEILRRMDDDVSWTVHLPGLKLTGDSPDRIEYNIDQLMTELQDLVDRGLVGEAAAKKAIRVKTVHEPAAAGIKALKKLGGEVLDAIEACEYKSSKPRRVSVVGDGPTTGGD